MELDFSKMKNKKICVAVSGGVDSMVLLHVLKKNEGLGYHLCALNFDHQIRGEESAEDSRFVEQICKDWKIPLYFFKEDCVKKAEREKKSLETAARDFRLEHYKKILEEGIADYIATAHHASDEAETILFRICRGSSLTGAIGIQENDKILRPLLKVTKKEILEYANQEGIAYREDFTNFERDATRNFLRLDVLPALEKRIPKATENLARFALIAAEDDEFLYKLSKELIVYTSEEICVSFCDKPPLFRRACLSVMKELGIERDYTFAHLQSLFQLQFLKMGARVTLPNDIEAQKAEKGIVFYNYKKKPKLEKQALGEIAFSVGTFVFGDYQITIEENEPKAEFYLRLDVDKLPKDCVIRTRKEGDLFEKFGGGTKTLKRYFIDKKIPKEDRELPLIAEKHGKRVYAIFGVEISEVVKVQKDSKTVYLTVKKYRR